MDSANRRQNIHEFVRHLLSAVTAASLYTLSHPQVERLAGSAFTSLSNALKDRQDLSLLVVDGDLVVDSEPQPGSMVIERFVQAVQELGVGHLRFLPGVTRMELNELIAFLGRQQMGGEFTDCEHIRLGKVLLDAEDLAGAELKRLDPLKSDKDLPGGLDTFALKEQIQLQELYRVASGKGQIKAGKLSTMVSDLVEAFNREGEAMMLLAALRLKDEYTFTHATNVCILALAQASSLGIGGRLLNDIGIAAMLHDIGKVFVPDEILGKQGGLTDEEQTSMRLHTIKGARYLMDTAGLPQLAAIVAFEHHLRFDRTGYPVLPNGWQQNIASQMTAIADCFDAMRTRRPYKEPCPVKDIAAAMIAGAGKEFNPLLVKNMLGILARTNNI